MADMNKTARQFYKAVEGVTKNERKGGYDTQATVRRIEDGIAYVHIPGGVDETPAKLTINASVGDVVQVRVANGRAFLVGNASAPPTDNTEAIKALTQADIAAQAAGIARQRADEATLDAQRAHDAADAAQTSADAAATAASNAQTSADNAQTSATTANTAANNALAGLGMVESVVDVVNWFAEHKALSTDTTVNANKTYYSYDASTGVLTKLDPVGTENPSALGWYELDDAISQYVASHVATTNDGLYVVSVANGWRVLVSSGGGNFPAGVLIIDPNGNVAQQTTVNGVEFNTGRPVKIGDQTAYINFDGNGHISVIGADLTIGGANNVSGVLTVKNATGTPVGTWNKDGIWTIAGTIGPLTILTDRLYSGQLSIGNTTYTSGTATVTKTILGVSSVENGEGRNVTIDADGLFSRYRIELAGSGGTTYYSNFPSASIQTTDYEDAGGNTWEQGILTLRTQRSVNGLSLLNRSVTLGLTPTGSATTASHVLDIVGSSSYVSGVRIRSSSSNDAASLIIQGHTEGGSLLYGSNNPAIYFQNSNATQNIALIFTDQDSVQAPASLTLAGNQGGEYFVAPNIKATDGLEVGAAKFYTPSETTATRSGSYITSGSITVHRRGNVGHIYGNITIGSTVTSQTTIATIPDGYRPVTTDFIHATNGSFFRVNSDGTLQAQNALTAGNYYFSTTYPLA